MTLREEPYNSNDRLDVIVENLLRNQELDELIEANPRMASEIMDKASLAVHSSFEEGDQASLRVLHRALCHLYEQNIHAPGTHVVVNQYNPFLIALRNRVEKAWDAFECSRLDVRREQIPDTPEAFISFFKEYCASHPAATHKLFDYFKNEATREDIIQFFVHDCALNVRFYDLIVLSMLGLDHGPRVELARNLWDEVGRGVEENTHTTLFKRVLEYVNVEQRPDNFLDVLDWQGLAGYNLYLYFGLHRKNYFRSIGNMAVTELQDPALYAKLLVGCKRVGLTDDRALAYYVEHITTDVEHGEGWLKNVMLPHLRADMSRAYEMLIGANMRLNTCLDYYEYLYSKIVSGVCV